MRTHLAVDVASIADRGERALTWVNAYFGFSGHRPVHLTINRCSFPRGRPPETDTSFQIAWPGSYRLDEPAFVYTDRHSRSSTVRPQGLSMLSAALCRRLPKAPALLAELEVGYRDSLFDDEPLPVLAAPERPKTQLRKREKIEPPSLQMDYPPTVADLLLGSPHDLLKFAR